MRRLLVLTVAVIALLVAPGVASAHPLGNFSVNHLAEVSVSADRVDVRYVLDQAEIPTFQERDLSDAAVLARKRAEVEKRLVLTVDGRRVPLAGAGKPVLTHPDGAGGLQTTRLELPLRATVSSPGRVELRDDTFPGRVGWHAVVPRPGSDTAVRSDVPASDPTGGLRRYPQDALSSPADVRVATLSVKPGAGTLDAPDGRRETGSGGEGREDVLSRAFSDAAAGQGVLLVLLLTAFAWGALHALSPGHGKAMVAAYLVGTRGTARHAVALGATVTVTHTAGVFLLGVVALGLSEYVLPEDLYPWLNLISGLMVLGVGAYVLRKNLLRRRAHHHHHHDHGHHHHHHGPDELSWRGILAMGTAAGIIPCPSALVVLLGAIAQGEIALGMLMIVAFSVGLAATLTILGLAVVSAGRAITRLNIPARFVTAIPALSALLIVGVGLVLTLQAVPKVA
ncbi:MAG TPA: sulfite exporter TauE/SafE family protein [Solirubrobacteraceae bacterium]|nr:sulfite exporter TauE/SafE family protein [Solirubrobacteraceae bacterium]